MVSSVDYKRMKGRNTHQYRTRSQNLGRFLVSAGYTGQAHALTNMNYVTLAIDHDVSIVSVLDLQDVTCDRIGCHRLNEVEASPLEFDSIFSTVFRNEEV